MPISYAQAALTGPVSALPYAHCSLAAVEEALPPASPALAQYLERVYGTAPRSQLVSWTWQQKDVLHYNHLPLPARMRACSPPLGNLTWIPPALATPAFYQLDCWSGYSRCFNNTALLWRFSITDEDRLCQGEPVHRGGQALPSKSALEEGMHGWVEVSHVNNYRKHDVQAERTQLWMDYARGSGLWYWRGKTLTASDIHNYAVRGHIFTHAFARRFDTVIIDHRVGDNGQIKPSRAEVTDNCGDSAKTREDVDKVCW